MSAEEDSVTRWLEQLKRGEHDSAQKLWERYCRALVGLARQKLQGVSRAVADEEDVVVSTFDSFFRGAEENRFPRLADRHDLWQVLVMIADRKAVNLIKHQGRGKRDWRKTQAVGGEDSGPPLYSMDPDPAFAAQVADELRCLFAQLADGELQAIARRKMEGYTNEELAEQFGCSVPTIERRLRLIRKTWEKSTQGLDEG